MILKYIEILNEFQKIKIGNNWTNKSSDICWEIIAKVVDQINIFILCNCMQRCTFTEYGFLTQWFRWNELWELKKILAVSDSICQWNATQGVVYTSATEVVAMMGLGVKGKAGGDTLFALYGARGLIHNHMLACTIYILRGSYSFQCIPHWYMGCN